MANALTAVMYHYVRPIKGSSFPGLKGMEVDEFEGQLDYLCRHHEIVAMEDVLNCLQANRPLPKRAALLTFDDGYRDHFDYVRPILNRRGLKGTFFVLAGASLDRIPIAANMIQHMLSAAGDVRWLAARMEELVIHGAPDTVVQELPRLRSQFKVATRLDSAEVIYVKRMLQMALPDTLREQILDILLKEVVGIDRASFAERLYCDVDNLRTLHEEGHFIGNHGDGHAWLSRLPPEVQRDEILGGLRLFDAIGLDRSGFVYCYPYGNYNRDSVEVLQSLDCAAAVTCNVANAVISRETRLEIARLDAIDFPCTGAAPACRWSMEVAASA